MTSSKSKYKYISFRIYVLLLDKKQLDMNANLAVFLFSNSFLIVFLLNLFIIHREKPFDFFLIPSLYTNVGLRFLLFLLTLMYLLEKKKYQQKP